jgi:hypothetical protein
LEASIMYLVTPSTQCYSCGGSDINEVNTRLFHTHEEAVIYRAKFDSRDWMEIFEIKIGDDLHD